MIPYTLEVFLSVDPNSHVSVLVLRHKYINDPERPSPRLFLFLDSSLRGPPTVLSDLSFCAESLGYLQATSLVPPSSSRLFSACPYSLGTSVMLNTSVNIGPLAPRYSKTRYRSMVVSAVRSICRSHHCPSTFRSFCCVKRSPNLFRRVIRWRDHLSSGEKRAGCADLVTWPSITFLRV